MILALSTMSATWQAILFVIAVICFVAAAIGWPKTNVNLIAVGLAFFVFVFAWNAVAAT